MHDLIARREMTNAERQKSLTRQMMESETSVGEAAWCDHCQMQLPANGNYKTCCTVCFDNYDGRALTNECAKAYNRMVRGGNKK